MWWQRNPVSWSGAVVQNVCNKGVAVEATNKTHSRCAPEKHQDPHKNQIKKDQVRQGRQAFGLPSSAFSAMLMLLWLPCCCGCLLQPPETPWWNFGNSFEGLVGGCDLEQIRYPCPSGTHELGAQYVAMTSHGDAELLQYEAAGSADQRLAAGFPVVAVDGGAAGMAAVSFPTGAAPWIGSALVSWMGWALTWTVPTWLVEFLVYGSFFIFHWHWFDVGRRKLNSRKKTRKPRISFEPRTRRRLLGRCRWVGGRRFLFKVRRYRILGRRTRNFLLHQLRRERLHVSRARVAHNVVHCRVTWWAQVVRWICGWLGCRVGEASHPGPGRGSDRDRPNKRKAVSVTASDHSADSGLAAALLEVLQTYQKGGPHQPHDEPPPSKKGKGGPKPKTSQTSGSPLARILIQTIQAALKQGVSDEVVASRVINKISRHGPDNTAELRAAESNGPRKVEGPSAQLSDTKRQLGEKLFHKISKLSNQAGKVTGMLLEQPVKEINKCLASDTLLKAKVDEALKCLGSANSGSWADKVTQSGPIRQDVPKSKGKGKQAGLFAQRQGAKPQRQTEAKAAHSDPGFSASSKQSGRRFAAKISDSEWTGAVKLTSLPQILGALRDGEEVPGNLVFSSDPSVADELKQVWNAYELQQPLTVAIAMPPDSAFPTVSIWWNNAKGTRPTRTKVKTVQVTDMEGPTPKPAQVVPLLAVRGPKLVTLRLLTPHFYRKFVAGVDREDSPSTVIAEWAQQTATPVASFTGGRWEKLVHPKGNILIAHLRVPERLAAQVCDLSGKRALFATVVTREDRPPVCWISKDKTLSDEQYFRSVSAQAQAKGVSVALRQSPHHNLGLVGIAPDQNQATKKRAWEIFGAPKHWYQSHVNSFLHEEGWKEVQVRAKVFRK